MKGIVSIQEIIMLTLFLIAWFLYRIAKILELIYHKKDRFNEEWIKENAEPISNLALDIASKVKEESKKVGE